MIWIIHIISVTMIYIITKIFKKPSAFSKLSFIYVIFVFGQRWMTGTDFPNYLDYYLLNFQKPEIGYFGLQHLFIELDLYFGLLITLILVITLYNNYKFIHFFEKNILLILYLYLISEVFFAQLSQIRQFVAISFFIISFWYSYQKKYIKSGVNILLATSFHLSAIFMIPFLFLKINKKQSFYVISLFIFLILPFIDISFILRLPIFNRYQHYLGSVYDVSLSGFHYIKYYIFIVLFLIFILNIERNHSEKENNIINGLFFYVLFYGLSFQFAPFLRIANYFKMYEIVFLAYYSTELKYISKKLTKTLIVILFLGIYIGTAIIDSGDIGNYQFRRLQLREDRSVTELYFEIYDFYNKKSNK